MGKVVNFHLPAADVQRALAFYRNVFGWSFAPLGDGSIPYYHASAEGAGIEAAITVRSHEMTHPTPTIEVDDIDAAMARIVTLGGQQSSVRDVPGIGRFGYAKDSEGNIIALLERTTP
ncbi:MAG TPA: VOC family protein [Candidatus Baltobacteraceae bacterium]